MHASDTVRYTRLTDHPYPIWLLSPNALPATSHGPISDLEKLLHEGGERPLFRGVTIDRLPTIITTGVDVEPSSAAIFCTECIDKALEYTRWPHGVRAGALMVFRSSHVDRSFCRPGEDATETQIAEIQRRYPRVHDNGTGRWFSRLPDSRVFDYEREYGYWIPGNAQEALAAVFLIGEIDKPIDYSPPGAQPKVWDPTALGARRTLTTT